MTDNESPHLTEATVQEIQLELIRRTQHNALDGRRVFEDLQSHRDLWKAVLIDMHPSLHLIKLRDLPYNDWNADTLFVLATNESNANRLAELAEDWQADTVQIYDQNETQRKLGFWSHEPHRVVEFWWD